MPCLKKVLSLLLIASALFGLDTGKINGMVHTDDSDQPVGFAQVVLQGTGQGVLTDESGYFELEGIAPGSYLIMVSHIGYDMLTQSVTVVMGQTLTLALALQEQPILLDEILISAGKPLTLKSQVYSHSLSEKAPRDVGDFFKSIAGGAAVKKGGYAQDPSLRGFQKDQLNIQFDGGIKVWGGCPNRMDPPTSHIQADDLKKIEVIKGPYSVRWGQTLGGIVNLVMQKPDSSPAFKIHGSASVGYESNGDNIRSRFNLSGGSPAWDFYLGGGLKSFHDYATGIDSISIPSAYEIKDYSAKLAYNFSQDRRLQLNLRQARVGDVDFPALPMDARKDASDIYSLGYTSRNLGSVISSIHSKIYVSNVSHIMDNLNRPNAVMVEAITDAETRTSGGRFEVGLTPFAGQILHVGLDYFDHSKQGYRERFVKTNPCNTTMHPNATFIDSIWQHASLKDFGGFAELTQILSPKTSYSVGVRGDQVTTTIGEPSSDFTQLYGSTNQWDEFNFSGMGILKYSPSMLLDLTISAGRGTRSADITERFINHLPVGASPHEHVGNPNLKAEINSQLEIGVEANLRRHRLNGNIFYSKLDNYIFARVDSSIGRKFLPCNDPKVSKVFENLNHAKQLGFEIMATGEAVPALSYVFTMAYTEGEDMDNSDPLPEMPPFEAVLNLQYELKDLPAWIRVEGRWVQAQERISLEYGETSTPGFNVYSLKLGTTLREKVAVNISINNLFDTAYHEHLSRNFAKNTAEGGLPLYEPGRNVILNVSYKL